MTASAGVAAIAAMSYCQWQFLLVALAGWINRHQQDVVAYLEEASPRPSGLRPAFISSGGAGEGVGWAQGGRRGEPPSVQACGAPMMSGLIFGGRPTKGTSS